MSLIQLALRRHRRPPAPPAASLPVVVPQQGSVPATLRLGSSAGPRWNIKGMNVWGLQSPDTNSTFGLAQYTNRAVVATTINGWGANMIRFRILADDYNSAPSAATGGLTKAQIIARIKDWRDTAVARGMYFCPCSWDALDGAFSDANWAGNGFRVHQMFADIYAALGDDPMVIYEPTNEPNSLGADGHDTAAWDAWQANMEASILYFRETMGYLGVLVIDPIWWSNSGPSGNGYDDARYTALEDYDASHPGMVQHQLVFAKHDYHDGYPSSVWNSSTWATAAGVPSTKHLIWENEFGNYNNATSNATWATNAAQFFSDQFDAQQNFVGAAPFLHGPWFDANATTTSDNATTTTWGQTVKVDYFESVPPPPPPPPPPAGTLAMPRSAVNSYGSAADFYDSVGVNIHFDGGGPYVSEVNTVADLAKLGIRHARDGGAGRFSWMSYEFYNSRRGLVAIRNRNAALPTPSSTDRGQPIFMQIDTPGWGHPSNLTGPFGYAPNTGYPTTNWNFTISRPFSVQEWFYGMNGGSNGWGHYDSSGAAPRNMPLSHDNSVGFRIPDGVTSNPSAVMPNPWAWSDPECAWEMTGGIAALNEAGLGWAGDHPAHTLMKAWCQAMRTILRNAAHQNKVVPGPPRVTEAGIQSSIRASQVPMAGVVVMSYGTLVDLYGDMSSGTNVCDVGDMHPYQPGVTPTHEWINRYNYPNRDGANFNGAMASPASPTNGLPWFATEVGQTTSTALADGSGPGGVTGPQNHNTWPTPPDVAAEYQVQMFLLHWQRNIRRSFIYELCDNTVGGFGLLDSSRNVKPTGYAVRNMLRLTGFSEASAGAKQKLTVTVSGFPSLPLNTYLNPITSAQWWQHAQRLDTPQMQVNDTTWLLWLRPQRKLWDRGVGNYNTGTSAWQAFANVSGGRATPSTTNLTVTLPAGVTSCEVGQPTAGMVGTNTAPYYTWADPDAGFAWTPLTITSNQVTVPLAGNTKVLRIVKAPVSTLFAPGMMFNADLGAADAGQNLGADVMRVEFSINNNVGSAGAARTTMDSWVDYYADRGIRMLMLAGFDGPSAPSVAQAQNLGSWAARYGSGGTFWAGRTDGNLAVQHIEFGNELNYNYQAGGTNAAQAQAYGSRCVTAYNSIQATGRPVGLLAMGMPSDSGAPEWLNNMFIGAPNLASIIAGWTIHPYGPNYAARVASHASQLTSHGVASTVPIDITEIGVSTDNGRTLDDNYGWATDMTYAQAGTTMTTVATTLRNGPQGSRLRHFMVYQTRDQSATGASTGREAYFGALQNNMAEKGAYSPAVRAIMNMT